MSSNIRPTHVDQTTYYIVAASNPPSCCNRWTFLQTVSGLAFIVSTLAVAIILMSAGTLGFSALFTSYSGLALFFLPSFISGASLMLFICSGCLRNYSSQSQITSIPSSQLKQRALLPHLAEKQPQKTLSIEEEEEGSSEINEIIIVSPEATTVADKNIQAIYTDHLDKVFDKFSQFFFQLVNVHHPINQADFKGLLANLWIFAKGLIFNDRFVATQLLSAIVKPFPYHVIKRQLIRAHNQDNQEALNYYSQLHQTAKDKNDLSSLLTLTTAFQNSKKKTAKDLDSFVLGFLTLLQEKQAFQTDKDDKKIEDIKKEFIEHLSAEYSTYEKPSDFIAAVRKIVEEIANITAKGLKDRKNRETLTKALTKIIDLIVAMGIPQDPKIADFIERIRAYIVTWTNDKETLTTYLKKEIPPFQKDAKVNLHVLSEVYFSKEAKAAQLMKISNYMLCWENILFEDPLDLYDEELLKVQYEINKGLKHSVALLYVSKGTSPEEFLKLPICTTVLGENFSVESLKKLNQKHTPKLQKISQEKDVYAIPCKMEAYPLSIQKEVEGGNMAGLVKPFIGLAQRLLPWLHDNFNLNLPLEIPGLSQELNNQWKALVIRLIPYVSTLYFDLMLSKTHPIKDTFATLLQQFSTSFENGLNVLCEADEIDLNSLEGGLIELITSLEGYITPN